MFRNLLFTMSLSGSVILLFYIISYPLAKRYFPIAWRYHILKTAMVFYLVPFSEYKYQIVDLMERLFPVFWSKIYHSPEFDSSYSIIVTNGVMHFSPKVKWMMFMLAVCGLISFIIILTWIIQYWKMKQVYLEPQEEPIPEKYREIFMEMKDRMGIRRNIKLLCSRYYFSPMTCGVIFPVVYFPHMAKEQEDMESCRYMMKHELIHIKRQDLLVKLLSLLVIAIHWFNPLSFLLYRELSNIGEIDCDDAVLKGKGEKERKEYCELLLEIATRKTERKERRFVMGMWDFENRLMFKRRILEMKVTKKKRTVFSMAAMVLACMAGGMTAFAYDQPKTLEAGDQEPGFEIEYTSGVDTEILLEIESMPYPICFFDEKGEIYELDETNLSERSGCSHNYMEDGTIKVHGKNSDGSCKIKIYEGKKCAKCGNIQLGTLKNTVSYGICPHGK